MVEALSPAERASANALAKLEECLEAGASFRFEAGAGAGKTYSLIEALKWLINHKQRNLLRRNQQIACITFTNVAKDEIAQRTDKNPVVFCDTNHAFCWSLISRFQPLLRTLIQQSEAWQEKLEESGPLGSRKIDYSLGHRSIRDDRVYLHHDDVLPFAVALMEHEKFRRLLTDRFPIILVDEYQDTNRDFADAIKRHFLGKPESPQFGFFGDHWQKIYDGGCGELNAPTLTIIGKGANFRSVSTIVDCLNRMRPELTQAVNDTEGHGQVTVLHTNHWNIARQTGSHWGGDLPVDDSKRALAALRRSLTQQGWDLSARSTKFLMLTHRVLANEQGYPTLPTVFKYNESFAKKEHPYISFFVDELEPAFEAYTSRKYGAMFDALGERVPFLKGSGDKVSWAKAMKNLAETRESGTVGDVVGLLRRTKLPRLPDAIEQREREVEQLDRSSVDEISERIAEIEKLRTVPYTEIIALSKYLSGHSPFETKHGVKGAQFENVVVVFGRGWSKYNFGEMLKWASVGVPIAKTEAYERNRNLFYVVCSRPKKRLALLFTQVLEPAAIETLRSWFGSDSVSALEP